MIKQRVILRQRLMDREHYELIGYALAFDTLATVDERL